MTDMASESLITRFVAWIRAGYPQGVPQHDYVPLMALVRRQVSRDEASAIAEKMAAEGLVQPDPTDIGVEITKVIDDLPTEADVARVQRRLARLDDQGPQAAEEPGERPDDGPEAGPGTDHP